MFTIQLYQFFSVFFLFALLSDEPEVFLPKYSQRAKLYAAHFWRVVNISVVSPVHSPVISLHEYWQSEGHSSRQPFPQEPSGQSRVSTEAENMRYSVSCVKVWNC